MAMIRLHERYRRTDRQRQQQRAVQYVPVTSVSAARLATEDRSTLGGRLSELLSLLISVIQS